jgi:hypothetical protein
LKGFKRRQLKLSNLKVIHALTIYPNEDTMFTHALQFTQEGLDKNEAAVLVGDSFSMNRMIKMGYPHTIDYSNQRHKEGLVVVGYDCWNNFRNGQEDICSQKELQSWDKLTYEALNDGKKAMRAFVDIGHFFMNCNIRALINQELEIDTGISGRTDFGLKIICGCLHSHIFSVSPMFYSRLQQCHNLVYAIP